jgi:L-alanine-DL-glutamate epimerase-like enolase superfamily enzyme
MKIRDLELLLVEVPRMRPLAPLRSMLVRLSSESGLEGWGEVRPLWPPGELAMRRHLLSSALAGRSVFDIEELLALDTLASRPLRAGVEMACWDLIAKSADQPLRHLWGGAFRSHVPILARLPSEPLEIVPYWARELAGQGFHAQMIGSTGSIENDLATVSAVREMTGGHCPLALDAQGRYHASEILRLCAELETSRIAFVLDPLTDGEPFRMAHLRRQVLVPLSMSAGIHTPADVLSVAGSAAASGVVLSLEHLGGLLTAYKCGVVAAAASLHAILRQNDSLGVGVAAMLQLAACLPGFLGAHECTHHQLLDDVLVEPLQTVEGMFVVPQGPGLGVQIDRGKLEQYQIA